MITWDEDDNAPGNQVATLVIADGVPPGFRSAVAYSHYSLLRTIELAWGLAPLTANDAGATVMSDFFLGFPLLRWRSLTVLFGTGNGSVSRAAR